MAIKEKTVVLCVTGGIAAYKSAALASALIKAGARVRVLMTEAAGQFIGAATFEALTRHPVYDNVFVEKKEGQIAHIDLADSADLFLVAPATANVIGKMAHGIADDLITTAILATKAPVWVAPAMNVNMYNHPAVQRNINILQSYGYRILEPDEGLLACGWTGKGRLAEPEEIFSEIEAYFSGGGAQILRGKKILVTAGPTQETIDPVRFFSNHSSGKMGFAIAAAAKAAGADVTLITGPTNLGDPDGIDVVHVRSAVDMYEAVLNRFAAADAVIKAAAVADYRPKTVHDEKIKKQNGPMVIEMVRNPDILLELGRMKTKQILVGFAAETDQLERYALQKLEKKHLDMIVANHVNAGFAKETNQVTFYFADGSRQPLERMAKRKVADKICEALAALFETRDGK